MTTPPAQSDHELLAESLREILRAPGTSGKALEAKASAARQLAALTGQSINSAADGAGAQGEVDPQADLDELKARRQRRLAG